MSELIANVYEVYVQTDAQGRVTAVNSSAFLTDTTGWTKIDEGEGDAYHHAQGNYLDGGLTEQHGIPRYKLVEGEAVARTQAELDADIAALPQPEPSVPERVTTLESSNVALMEGLAEVYEAMLGTEV
jgi:hypothetical protein